MRIPVALIASAALLFAGESRAASPALFLELADEDPIGVRVQIPANATSCNPALDLTIFEDVLQPRKPVVVPNSAPVYCVSRANAPLKGASWSPPLLVHRRPDGPTVPIRFRSPKAGTQVPPINVGTPLVVSLQGKERIGVRVAAGAQSPCNATGNALLGAAVLEPDHPLTIETGATCVCVEQTYAPYVTMGWTPGTIHCRPMRCVGKDCRMDLGAPFTLALASRTQ